ncbi:MAG: M23 family metallopeptidase [Bacteroides sp.]|nr:M23 family metallopeptidase [Bacteroides sp.]
MKRFLIPIIYLAFSLGVQAKNPPFTPMEINHIRVATPGLFDHCKCLELHLDSLSDTDYSFPLPGGKVISKYGRGNGRHTGIDIKTCAKDTIRSAFDGVVRMSKPYSAYGNVIVVRHSFGLETIYSHNFKNLVQSGDTVKAGQPIALTGRTGRATTEHLHFETRINGQHFNPNIVFNMEARTLRKECILCTKSGNGIVVKPAAKK